MTKSIKQPKYHPRSIERKWQKRWLDDGVYSIDDTANDSYYQLETFPYPSAAGLHVGHPKGYIADDIHVRFQRMHKKSVLYSMGWDAFGLPTENYAIKVGKTPQVVARENIKNFKKQIQMFGLSYDWNRELNTADPTYYKWTQWLFIKLFEKGLAYRKTAKVNWCETDKTVLAHEQAQGGLCERCGQQVIQKDMEQWFFKITDEKYIERLIDDLIGLDWPDATKKRQQDWIGRSEGAKLRFDIEHGNEVIKVFTTRPDTLYGATYLVLAPEHVLLQSDALSIQNKKEVDAYIKKSLRKTERERQEEAGDKTGLPLEGVMAINPATKEAIPIWVADYVLAGYGTGAIMAVPAHDARDHSFATKFDLPIVEVLKGERAADGLVYQGTLMHSGEFDGYDFEAGKHAITKSVNGEKSVHYRLRDWSVSRQRYWGVPIPIVYCKKCGIIPVPESDLPVVLPIIKDYRPHGMSPLASSKKFMNVVCPQCGSAAQRDSDTLDTFVDSSWYFFRYIDPTNDELFADKKKLKRWMPVDMYVIGAEHAVLHLLYARFITKFLFDEGYVTTDEPFTKLRHVGLIQGSDGQKMSKSKGNVVNPDEIVSNYGADAVRLYEMFMGPFEDGQPWDPKGVNGMERFLNRIWTWALSVHSNPLYGKADDKQLNAEIHQTIKKVTEDIGSYKFNTAIASLMSLLNKLYTIDEHGSSVWLLVRPQNLEAIIKILFPFVPHICQELWSLMGKSTLLDKEESWPEYDDSLIAEKSVTIGIQINGKIRAELAVSDTMSDFDIKNAALKLTNVKKNLAGAEIKKFIYIKNKIISIVV